MPDRLHVFVAGLHRSGTSLLFQCLRDHPRVSAFRDTGVPEDEGQHLQPVYRPAAYWGGPGMFGFAAGAHLTEESALATPSNQKRLAAAWDPYWDLSRPVLLEKSPQNLIQTRFLQAMFPRSAFIAVTRHPAAVAYATRKWSHSSLYTLVEHWCRCHEILAQDRPHLKRAMVVRYEDLASRPETALAELYRFLDLEPSPTTVTVRGGVNERYFTRWRVARRRFVSRPYMERIVATFEDRVAPFGYSLRQLTEYEDAVAPATAGPVVSLLQEGWCHINRGAGAVRRGVLKSGKRLRNRLLAAAGIARRRRSAVH
jgi:hypothetical protein